MNQILSFKTIGNSKVQLKKVIKFFSVFIIFFGIILATEGAFGYYQNKNKKVIIGETPNISIKRNNDITILNITSKIGVHKIIYSWNDGIETTMEKSGEKELEVEIPTTLGTNDLNIKIVDSNGNTITYDSVKIAYDGAQDTNENWEEAVKNDKTKPILTVESVKGRIVITAKDDVKMSYVTYSWNGEEENKVTGLSDDEKSLTTEIDSRSVKKGTNKLVVKAYDKAGNVETVEKEVQGGHEIVLRCDSVLNESLLDYDMVVLSCLRPPWLRYRCG